MPDITAFLLHRVAEGEALAAALLDRASERHDEVRIDRGTWLPDDVDAVAAPVYAPCPTLRTLAQVYADHPDYDPAWNA